MVGLVVGLFSLACAAPALDDGRHRVCGLAALLAGWRAPFLVPWSANLFLGAGVHALLRGRHRTSSLLGALGAGLALTTRAVLPDHLGVGYYLWQASPVLLALGAHVLSGRRPVK